MPNWLAKVVQRISSKMSVDVVGVLFENGFSLSGSVTAAVEQRGGDQFPVATVQMPGVSAFGEGGLGILLLDDRTRDCVASETWCAQQLGQWTRGG